VALEVIAEVCGNESNSSSDADRRQLAAVEKYIHLAARDGEKGGCVRNGEQALRPVRGRIYRLRTTCHDVKA
jgi:hypothetical protein